MKAIEAVKEAANRSGVSLYAVSKAMGKDGNYMSAYMWRGSTPQADTLAAMLDACGYDLVAVPKGEAPGCALAIGPPSEGAA